MEIFPPLPLFPPPSIHARASLIPAALPRALSSLFAANSPPTSPSPPAHVYVWKSFGDTHTSIPVYAQESERAGRFVGRMQTECGIHTRIAAKGKQSAIQVHLSLFSLSLALFFLLFLFFFFSFYLSTYLSVQLFMNARYLANELSHYLCIGLALPLRLSISPVFSVSPCFRSLMILSQLSLTSPLSRPRPIKSFTPQPQPFPIFHILIQARHTGAS